MSLGSLDQQKRAALIAEHPCSRMGNHQPCPGLLAEGTLGSAPPVPHIPGFSSQAIMPSSYMEVVQLCWCWPLNDGFLGSTLSVLMEEGKGLLKLRGSKQLPDTHKHLKVILSSRKYGKNIGDGCSDAFLGL